MKRTLKIALVACFVLGFSAVSAQETEVSTSKAYYPHYGFWSNWSVGIHGGATLRLQKETMDPNTQILNEENRWGWGIGGFLAKELNHVWDVRFNLLYADVDSKIKLTNTIELKVNENLDKASQYVAPNKATTSGLKLGLNNNKYYIQ